MSSIIARRSCIEQQALPQPLEQFQKESVPGPYYASRMEWPGSASYHRQLNEHLLEFLPKERSLAVLDDMCGTGVFLPSLQDRYDRVVGADLSRLVLDYARRHADSLVQSDAQGLPFKSASFDLVVIRGGLHHVPDMPRALAEVTRLLKPGGMCLLLEPREDNRLIHVVRRVLYHLLDAFEPEQEHGLTSRELYRLLDEAGLRITAQEPYGLLGFALYCNPDTVPFTRPFSFLPGAARAARWMSRLDRALNRLPGFRAFAFETLVVATKAA